MKQGQRLTEVDRSTQDNEAMTGQGTRHAAAPLSNAVFGEVRPDFFRVLAGPLARLYLDALEALEKEASQRPQGLGREEALALVEDVVVIHPEILGEPDESINRGGTNRDRARAILDTLRTAGWIQEEERTDWQRLVFFDPNGTILLHAIRKIAFPRAAVFSDKLVNVCLTLSRSGGLNVDALADNPWGQIEACVANLQGGIAELRGMQKSIERHTKQQLNAETLRQNLEVLFDQFAERIGRACYTHLVHARLPSKLSEARRAIEELMGNAELLTKMQSEVLHRDPLLSPESAMVRVRLRLNELEEMLLQIEPLADAIDRRTAEFTRRSEARFRYLQETTSENRARVQRFFETINRHFAGRRVRELDNLGIEFPALLLHELRNMGGFESLYSPRLRRTVGEIEPLDELDPSQADRALAQLESNIRDSISVKRANDFVSRLPGERGSRWDSSDLLQQYVTNDEDITNVVACLLHARSSDASFQILVPRLDNDADIPEFDQKLQYRIERFILVKK
jgi:DNA repair exonuclease SbcCD ATPase subunit